MLGRLESMSLDPNIKDIAEALDCRDFNKMKSKVHNLKGACGYVGASRVHYACYWIQDAHFHGQVQEMIDLYPKLIEASVEFKRYSRQVLANKLLRGARRD
jgi:HPt (histidine-containing phosphotransfer) domain-containing protein